ncbi:MAG: polyprenyl synthetase family protein [Prevotellaceae bacterium]|jgi:octaprenyl-diphosphate synthase|nr:polyprenyl synthetase family protein [Prevotellaceae bacterium]
MISIEQIKKPIAEEFRLFDTHFQKAFESNNELLSVVNHYILENKGKQIRPILTFLSAKICGIPTVSTIHAAVSLELLHTASLIHDDIVDDTFERRGRKSVNAIWKNKIAVLVGDFLLSKSLAIANETQNFGILNEITNLGKELSEGELLQISNTKNFSTNEEKYFDVILKKTATLFSTCTKLGAISVNASDEKIDILRKFGEIYGICFQIRDDIFDYISSEKEIGKPVGNDIREGKITLPLLYALNNTGKPVKEEYISILKEQHFSEKNIKKLISFAIENGGIEYAEKRMTDFRNKAVELIKPFPENEIKEALLLTLEHTIQRNR